MKIYLAGRFEDQFLLREASYMLIMLTHEIASTWLWSDDPYETEKEKALIALKDYRDIQACDTLVLYSHLCEPLPTRQAHSTELGLALAMGKRVIIVGVKTENVFHHLPSIEYCPAWGDLMKLLQSDCIMKERVGEEAST